MSPMTICTYKQFLSYLGMICPSSSGLSFSSAISSSVWLSSSSGVDGWGLLPKNKTQRQSIEVSALQPESCRSVHLSDVATPALRSPPERPVSACSSMLLGGILVPKAVWMLSTKFLQWELSTQILSPNESSMYTCNYIKDQWTALP